MAQMNEALYHQYQVVLAARLQLDRALEESLDVDADLKTAREYLMDAETVAWALFRRDMIDQAEAKEPRCVDCNGPVERVRWCYVHPTCYACLPPPEPLEVINETQ